MPPADPARFTPMDSKVVKSTDESAKSALEVGDEFGLIKTYFGDVNAIQIGEQVAFEHGRVPSHGVTASPLGPAAKGAKRPELQAPTVAWLFA